MAAPHVPEAAVSALSVHTLAWLDQELMTPSSLPPQRRDVLVQALRDHAVADGRRIEHTLLFRNGGPLGANAFALPDGTLIVTDELIALAEGDDEVLAVLAHELGHVQLRHGVRLLLQGSATALFMAWYFGDVGSLLASAPTLLVQAGYSRGMEGEADDFAVRMLRERGQSPALLAGMLEKLRAAHGGRGRNREPGPGFPAIRTARNAWIDCERGTSPSIDPDQIRVFRCRRYCIHQIQSNAVSISPEQAK
jgi:Zn-dependent protease with chaperone function